MKRLGVLSAVSCLLISLAAPAFATTWNEYDSYWVAFNFSGATDFDGVHKTVASVFAHAGVLRGGGGACGGFGMRPGDWQDDHDVAMTKVGDHFFGKSRFNGSTGECQVGVQGAIVQYWVTYTDGSTLITQSTLIDNVTDAVTSVQGIQDFQSIAAAQDKALDALTDAPATSATRLHYQWAD